MRSSLALASSTKIGKQQIRRLKIIINCLNQSSDSFDFRQPVDWKGMGLTDYLTIVKQPMDLSTVLKKFKQERYNKIQQILDDIQLIWDNCKAYNPHNSWIHSLAQKLQRSFKKMVKNYFPDLNIVIPQKIQQQKQQKLKGLFEDDGEDITYQQKLKFSQQLSFLNSDQLAKVLDEIISKCPQAYKDTGDGKGQILVDNIDLIFFSQISIMVRNMLNTQLMDEQRPKPRRGRPPNPK